MKRWRVFLMSLCTLLWNGAMVGNYGVPAHHSFDYEVFPINLLESQENDVSDTFEWSSEQFWSGDVFAEVHRYYDVAFFTNSSNAYITAEFTSPGDPSSYPWEQGYLSLAAELSVSSGSAGMQTIPQSGSVTLASGISRSFITYDGNSYPIGLGSQPLLHVKWIVRGGIAADTYSRDITLTLIDIPWPY